MKNLKLALKNKEKDPASFDELYEIFIIQKIRKRYSINQELAILRQRYTKPYEFEQYNAYVEYCKNEVKMEMGI
jgi:hypothetical protein